jgi:drug/metabolite transporter (DMT)-like permease
MKTSPQTALAMASPPDREGLGILQTFVAVLAGVGNNFCFKLLAALPVSQIIVLRSASALVLLVPLIALAERRKRSTASPFSIAALTRAACEASATALLIVAVTHMPLALVTAMLMTIPIITALIGRVVLKEVTPPLAWVAIACGLAGTLLLLRPGLEASPVGIAAAGLSALAYALRDALTRRMPRGYGSLTMTATAIRRRCCSGSRSRRGRRGAVSAAATSASSSLPSASTSSATS